MVAPLTKISCIISGLTQLQMEGKVLISHFYTCFWFMRVCLIWTSVCTVCVFHCSSFSTPWPLPQDQLKGKEIDDGSVTTLSSTNSCLASGVCSSLWPHPPPHFHGPSLLRRLRLSLGCFELPYFATAWGRGPSALWCAACLPCLPPRPSAGNLE